MYFVNPGSVVSTDIMSIRDWTLHSAVSVPCGIVESDLVSVGRNMG